jgi:LPPG:FO 2-phospho-L-lactate transferase
VSERGAVVVLAGGTGGAKFARGMLDVVAQPEDLVVVANTGDDVEVYGAHVSPDPDLVTFWLADRIDARGWGIEGDTFRVMEGLRALGAEVWFNLGDLDLAVGIERLRALHRGARLTEAQSAVSRAFGVRARVLPMADQPVRTRILAHGRSWSLQEFLISGRGAGPVDDVDFRGAGAAAPTPEVREAIATAGTIVIGPSNPVISIGPILSLPAMRSALRDAAAPVIAVSPIVQGEVLKGPTRACMEWAGMPVDAAGVARLYADVIDGIVTDGPVEEVPFLATNLLMDGAAGRRRLAAETLAFAESLARSPEPRRAADR